MAAATGAVTLGELVGRLDMLEVACTRCDRRGRYRLATLLGEHGSALGIPDWLGGLRQGCPKHQGAGIHDRCGAHCPQLVGLSEPRNEKGPRIAPRA